MSEDENPDEMLRYFSGSGFTLKKPKKLGVAVSGGGDSMACLDLMIWHGRDLGFPVEAVTLDHGLRPEAGDEIALVAAYCAEWNVPHSVLTWAWDGSGNLQSKARNARYRLIGEWAKQCGADLVALGHTKDDVAETFLMRLARQSGIDGLAHMERSFEREGVDWTRPLLSLGRAKLRSYLKRHEVEWAEDPSNNDPKFERVRARQVLEALEPLEIDADVLASVAHNLWLAKSSLDLVLRASVFKYVVEDRGDLIVPGEIPEKDGFIPPEVIYRLRRVAIRWVGGANYAPRSKAMFELEDGLREKGMHTLAGCIFRMVEGKKTYERRFRITREYNAVRNVVSSTDAPWDGRWVLEGPHDAELQVRALGDAVKNCQDWRGTGLPRQSLLASPAIWRGDELVAAPLAGLENGWTASATGRGTFSQFLLSR